MLTQFRALRRVSIPHPRLYPPCHQCHKTRQFSSSTTYRQQNSYKEPFGKRLRKALGETKIKWYPIPVGLGIAFLGLVELYRINERERARLNREGWEDGGESGEEKGRPKPRERIRPTGPW
jgi:phosphatidylserine decarboxylase